MPSEMTVTTSVATGNAVPRSRIELIVAVPRGGPVSRPVLLVISMPSRRTPVVATGGWPCGDIEI